MNPIYPSECMHDQLSGPSTNPLLYVLHVRNLMLLICLNNKVLHTSAASNWLICDDNCDSVNLAVLKHCSWVRNGKYLSFLPHHRPLVRQLARRRHVRGLHAPCNCTRLRAGMRACSSGEQEPAYWAAVSGQPVKASESSKVVCLALLECTEPRGSAPWHAPAFV
jgi:hypothetical protein